VEGLAMEEVSIFYRHTAYFTAKWYIGTFCGRLVYFQTKNPNFGKLWRALRWKKLVFFMDILSILQPNGIKVHFVAVWYIFAVLVCCTEKNLATLIKPDKKASIPFFLSFFHFLVFIRE
jgi:hypothetical protein